MVVVGLYALLVSYFATTRRGIYFALLTLIFAEVVYTFFRYTQTFGGSDGIQGLPARRACVPGVALDTPLRNYYLVVAYLALRLSSCAARWWSPRTSARCWSPSARTRTAPASSATTCSATRWACA